MLRAVLYKPFLGSLGRFSYIGKPTYIGNFNRIFIDDKVRIFPGARIEVVDKKSSIRFKSNISIGQNLHIISAEKLIIGKNTTISANVFITNIDHEYREIDTHILKQPHIVHKTEIGENCFIGYGVVLQAGTILGKQCIVGANSVVRGTFPAYSVIVGVPAKVVKRYDHSVKKWKKTNKNGEFIDE
jgi:acetyltransferase-like isoleucine patch superfamily enzyme